MRHSVALIPRRGCPSLTPPVIALVILMASGVTACSSPETPEQQVRRVIDEVELAAEARDTGELMDHVSAEYRDGYGQNRDGLSRYVRGYFVSNQSIHLLSRIEKLDFTSAGEARAIVQVGMAAREAATSGNWNLATEIRRFEVVLRNEPDGWKITYADWARQ